MGHGYFYNVLCIATQMMLGQDFLEIHPKRRATQNAGERNGAGG